MLQTADTTHSASITIPTSTPRFRGRYRLAALLHHHRLLVLFHACIALHAANLPNTTPTSALLQQLRAHARTLSQQRDEAISSRDTAQRRLRLDRSRSRELSGALKLFTNRVPREDSWRRLRRTFAEMNQHAQERSGDHTRMTRMVERCLSGEVRRMIANHDALEDMQRSLNMLPERISGIMSSYEPASRMSTLDQGKQMSGYEAH